MPQKEFVGLPKSVHQELNGANHVAPERFEFLREAYKGDQLAIYQLLVYDPEGWLGEYTDRYTEAAKEKDWQKAEEIKMEKRARIREQFPDLTEEQLRIRS